MWNVNQVFKPAHRSLQQGGAAASSRGCSFSQELSSLSHRDVPGTPQLFLNPMEAGWKVHAGHERGQ